MGKIDDITYLGIIMPASLATPKRMEQQDKQLQTKQEIFDKEKEKFDKEMQ